LKLKWSEIIRLNALQIKWKDFSCSMHGEENGMNSSVLNALRRKWYDLISIECIEKKMV